MSGTAGAAGEREAAIATIQRELTAFARRARAAAAQMHPELSLVSFTLLAHLEDSGGCRAPDLAAHLLLDKSTVSRQVAALERAGHVERRGDPDDHRMRLLHLTEQGEQVLARAADRRSQAFQARLGDWEPAELERFAAYLTRYNDEAG
ncbi:MarR family winged helix-turn-helix transcriptional regulator [Streptomyces sp. N35]|uniref:MarR family winged helix-turn-helix transcriptional regulator n=1 Tax=Streptomyces sp. N35 TaxID=2795730 RepID=UPI0018F37C6B|nr:MarR family transcriptional regulator [Streptomyces sp. N35]